MRRTTTAGVFFLAGLWLVVGCGEMGSGMGATPGGVQDLRLAREIVDAGRVPPPEALLVEGMFSEHDLPLEGQACEETLCLRGAVGVAPTHDGLPSGWLQVGMSSNVDPETFERAPQTLIFTVDVSGSMGWSYSDEDTERPSAGQLARALMEALASELGPRDRVAIVTYGSRVDTPLGLVAGDSPRLARAIEDLGADGSTNMEAGLERAYELARGANGTGPVRVMLFTDVQPNVGATTPSEFERMVGAGADDGIGLTVFGLGLGMGPELFDAMSTLRGGNAFSLVRLDDVPALMEDSWPWMVSPLAEDLHLELAAGPGYEVGDAYGIPGGDDPARAGLDVATVFLSRRRGAILVRLVPTGANDLAGLSVGGTLSYRTPEGRTVEGRIDAQLDGTEPLDEGGRWFAQPSVGKATALALLVSGMHRCAEAYREDPAAAAAEMATVHARFVDDAAALGDAELDREVAFSEALLGLMESGASQDAFYGGGY